jgi:hypothetical protein
MLEHAPAKLTLVSAATSWLSTLQSARRTRRLTTSDALRDAHAMKRAILVMTVLLAAGCGDNSSGPAAQRSPNETSTPATAAESPSPSPTVTATPTREATVATEPAALECEEPSGQEKASLRFAVRGHDRELKDDPWVLVRKGSTHYMAAEIDSSGPRAVVVVKFSSGGRYLAGMRAVNGTARTFTDLPDAGDRLPAAALKALDCMDS